jgi:hypothetical protein
MHVIEVNKHINNVCLIVLVVILLSASISCDNGTQLKFESLDVTDGKTDIDFHYMMTNYKDVAPIHAKIDSFACAWYKEQEHIWGYLYLSFYKKTRKTNQEYISRWPREFHRHSAHNDLLFIYSWHKDAERGTQYAVKTKYTRNQVAVERVDFDCNRK